MVFPRILANFTTGGNTGRLSSQKRKARIDLTKFSRLDSDWFEKQLYHSVYAYYYVVLQIYPYIYMRYLSTYIYNMGIGLMAIIYV